MAAELGGGFRVSSETEPQVVETRGDDMPTPETLADARVPSEPASTMGTTSGSRPPRTPSPPTQQKNTLTTWVGTWNVGNVAPTMDACVEWLGTARGHDFVAVAAQEASYPHSKTNLKPEDVWGETMLATRGRDAGVVNGGDGDVGTAVSTSEDPLDSTPQGDERTRDDGQTSDPQNSSEASFTKKKRGFFNSSKFTRATGALAGALAGGVALGPLAPFGLVAGAAAGYYSSAKVAAELKSRRHWFELVRCSLGPEYSLVQSATLLQARLVVFVKKSSVIVPDLIQEVRVGACATGVFNAVGNKGGLMVRVRFVTGDSIAFVAAHLAAHEGEKHVAARDESAARILRGVWDSSVVRGLGALGVEDEGSTTCSRQDDKEKNSSKENKKDPKKKEKGSWEGVDGRDDKTQRKEKEKEKEKDDQPQFELLACTTHVFLFGDLNYRIDPGMVGVGDTRGNKSRWGSRWKKSNDAPSGSIVAAIGGLTASRAKKKNADEAFAAIERARNLPGGDELRVTDSHELLVLDESAKESTRACEDITEVSSKDASKTPSRQTTSEDTKENPSKNQPKQQTCEDTDNADNAKAATKRWVEGWHLVVDAIAARDWGSLIQGDQLSRQTRLGAAMHGFVEAPITFAPTFKFQDEGDTVFTETGKPVASAETGKATESKRTSGSIPDGNDTYPYTKYSKKRIPSWCDRVLCRSLGNDGNGAVRWVAYKSCPAVASSDHTPVYAVCEVDVYGRSQPEKLPVTPNKKEEGLPIETETEVLPSQTENNAPGEGDGELTTRDQTIPIGTAIGASSVSPKTPPRKLFLKFSVASFRVTLEAFADPADTKPDCDVHDEHDEHDAPTYDVPGTPMYRAGSVSKKESMMEKLMASTHVSSGDSVAGRETVTPRNTTKSFVAKPSGTKPSSAEASASALPAMDRLNKGAVAVARFNLTNEEYLFHELAPKKTFANRDLAKCAGVTFRPSQPVQCEKQSDKKENENDDERDDALGSDAQPVFVTSTEMHWTRSTLPCLELELTQQLTAGDGWVTEIGKLARALRRAAVVAAVSVANESAGCAAVSLFSLVEKFLETLPTDSLESNKSNPPGGTVTHHTTSVPFSVPFDRFARRRGCADGALALEVVEGGVSEEREKGGE